MGVFYDKHFKSFCKTIETTDDWDKGLICKILWQAYLLFDELELEGRPKEEDGMLFSSIMKQVMKIREKIGPNRMPMLKDAVFQVSRKIDEREKREKEKEEVYKKSLSNE